MKNILLSIDAQERIHKSNSIMNNLNPDFLFILFKKNYYLKPFNKGKFV